MGNIGFINVANANQVGFRALEILASVVINSSCAKPPLNRTGNSKNSSACGNTGASVVWPNKPSAAQNPQPPAHG
jgi:hypothetical protein